MEKFNKKYFDDIWGTVHRHDYCESLAESLITKYGKVRFLDIGTGCGELVRVLREKGCDAWGMEISQYALENSHGYVREGDIRNIPFASDSFDVVHSQGVWGYFPEEDIQKAWAECKRVGKIQHHNIDYLDEIIEHQYLLKKSQEWWKNQFYPKILIACPTHIVKDYSTQRWIDNIKKFTYPNFDTLLIDNSPTNEMVDKWKDKTNIRKIDTTGIEALTCMRMNLSFEEIRKEFLAGDYKWLATIESDIIPPHNVLEFMIETGKDADWISHAFPNRRSQTQDEQGIGCCLFSRRLMEAHDFGSLGDNYTSDGGLWMKVRPDRRFKTMELWNYIDIVHLAE